MATKLKIQNNTKDHVFKESQVSVILEDMRDEIKIIAEGQIGLRQELKRDIKDLRDEMKDVRDEIKIVAEGQIELRQELKKDINDLRGELKSDISDLRSELKGDISGLRNELKGDISDLRDEMRSNFKTVFEYLSKIDEEIQEIKLELQTLKESKLDKALYFALEKRVLKMEKQVERMLAAQKIKK